MSVIPSLRRRLALLVLLFALTASSAPVRQRRVAFPAPGIDQVRRVFIVILENEDEANAAKQPFLAQLAARGALLTNYHAITHPSQPNYFALTAGDTFDTTDSHITLYVRHVGDLMEAHGLSWKVYAEDLPGECYLGDAHGRYVRRHVPFLSYRNVQENHASCATHVVNATQLDADIAAGSLPEYAFYAPNLDNDGHDTGVAAADRWLAKRFGPLLSDPRFMAGTLFVVTFDEGNANKANLVYCALVGAGVRSGAVSNRSYDHYDLLRTVEAIFHTGSLGRHDDVAHVIDDVWQP